MVAFFLRRLIATIPTIFAVVTLAFVFIHMAPGGPFDQDRALPDDVVAQLERAYHMDWPLLPVTRRVDPQTGERTGRITLLPFPEWHHTQYLHYLKNLLRGDLGPSTRYPSTSVTELLASGLPATLVVGGLSLTLSLGVGLLAGLLAGWKPNTLADYGAMAVVMLGISISSFVLAPLLVGLFSLGLGWLPVAGFSSVRHMLLPALCLGALNAAYVARLSRGAMLEIMPQDFIRTARATGYTEFQVVTVHALRGALIPVISFLGPAVAATLTGSLVIESIFNIPGIGRHFVQAALNRDYTLVMGTVIFYSVLLLLANLVVDMVYAVLDPRVRYG